MASNTSSVFNEAPTETKPANAPPTTSTEARPVASVGSAATTTAAGAASSSNAVLSPTESDKQIAPKMESVMEERPETLLELGSSVRFAMVTPVGVSNEMKTALVRKSCLKRSISSLPATLSVCEASAPPLPLLSHAEADKKVDVPVQKNRRRCWHCRVKVGLTAVKCRCDYTFCNKHRYAEEHNCRFNFRGAAKRKLEEENPRVVPQKVARIN